MNTGTVHMQSPEGEIREVPASIDALSPMMAAGWLQVPEPPKADGGTTKTRGNERSKD